MLVWKSEPRGALQVTRDGVVYRVTIATQHASVPMTPKEMSDLAVAILTDVTSSRELVDLSTEA